MSIREIQSVESGSKSTDSVDLMSLGLTENDWSNQLTGSISLASSEALPLPKVEIEQPDDGILDLLDRNVDYKSRPPAKVPRNEIPRMNEETTRVPLVEPQEKVVQPQEVEEDKPVSEVESEKFDPNVDASDSAFELARYLEANFKDIDNDRDNQISRGELKDFRNSLNEEGQKTVDFVLGSYVALKQLSTDSIEFAEIPTEERGVTRDDIGNLSGGLIPGLGLKSALNGSYEVWKDNFLLPAAVLGLAAKVYPKAMFAFGLYMALTAPMSSSIYLFQRSRLNQIVSNDRRYESPFQDKSS